MKVVLFCGGLGLRLRDHIERVPKPMVPIGYRPILWHIMKYYAHYGHRDFTLCLGYKADVVKQYFLDYNEALSNDFVLDGNGGREAGRIELLGSDIHDWRITFADTGLHANIGQRLVAVKRYVQGEEVFLANYGDVLTDADIGAMLRFHAGRRARATIYLVPVPDPTPYGLVELESDGRVRRFIEKPDPSEITTNTINAGFYVIDRALIARMPAGRVVSIEREFFPGLLADAVPFFGWVDDHYWLDIGSPAKYRQGQHDLLMGTLRVPIAPALAAARPSSDEAGCVVSPSVIGAGCRLACATARG